MTTTGGTLNQSCDIITTSKDMYGKFVKSDPATTKCRIKEKYQLVKNKAAETVVSSLEFWFSSDITVKLDDLIKFNGKEYPIVSINNKKNTKGEITRKVVYT